MKKYHLLFLMLMSLFLSSPVFALYLTQMTGEKLLQNCNSALKLIETKVTGDIKTLVIEAGLCGGYIAGMEDMHAFYTVVFAELYTNKNQLLYCLPNDVKPIQLIKIIVKYLNDHPEELNKSASLAVIQAYKLNFPCP